MRATRVHTGRPGWHGHGHGTFRGLRWAGQRQRSSSAHGFFSCSRHGDSTAGSCCCHCCFCCTRAQHPSSAQHILTARAQPGPGPRPAHAPAPPSRPPGVQALRQHALEYVVWGLQGIVQDALGARYQDLRGGWAGGGVGGVELEAPRGGMMRQGGVRMPFSSSTS